MKISILFGFTFICCWVLLMISWVLTLITQAKLKNILKNQAPEIRNDLKFGFSSINNNASLESPFGIFKVLFSFGNQLKVKSFLNQFFDIDSVEHSDNQNLKILSKKLITQFSISVKLWAIATLLVILGIITLSIVK